MSETRGPRIALLTGRAWPQGSPDDAPLVSALTAHGVATRWVPWRDAALVARQFDAFLVRSCWDYTHACESFLDTLDAVRAHGGVVWNAPALVRWNADKRYLVALASAGVDVVPTLLWDGADPAALAGALRSRGWNDVVLKPAVSSGARGALRVAAAQIATRAGAHLAAHPAQRWLAQPYLPEIGEGGEWSLVFFGGALSHAVRKRPAEGDFRVQERHGGRTHAQWAPLAVQRAAARVLDAVPEPPLYARVDGVVHDGRFLLMELELIEPMLFLAHDAGAAGRLARSLVAALGRVRSRGAGPPAFPPSAAR